MCHYALLAASIEKCQHAQKFASPLFLPRVAAALAIALSPPTALESHPCTPDTGTLALSFFSVHLMFHFPYLLFLEPSHWKGVTRKRFIACCIILDGLEVYSFAENSSCVLLSICAATEVVQDFRQPHIVSATIFFHSRSCKLDSTSSSLRPHSFKVGPFFYDAPSPLPLFPRWPNCSTQYRICYTVFCVIVTLSLRAWTSTKSLNENLYIARSPESVWK